MKLKTKIQFSFCFTMIIILLIIGIVTGNVTTSNSMSIVDDSLASSASLVANHISQKFSDYICAITLVGKNDILTSDIPVEEKMNFLQTYVDTYGFTSANILDKNGVSLNDGTDFSEREYVKKALAGEPNISNVTLSKYTETYGMSIAAPYYDSKGIIDGVVYFRIDMDFISEFMNDISVSKNSYSYIIDNEGNIIFHPDESLVLNFNMIEQGGKLKKIAENAIAGNSDNENYTYNSTETVCGYSPIGSSTWSIIIAAPKSDFTKANAKVNEVIFILAIVSNIIVLIISTVISKNICNPINKVKNALVSVAKGELNVKVDKSNGKDEVAVLQNTTASLLDTLSHILGEANRILSDMANYDLTADDMSNYPGEFNTLSYSVNSIKSTLNQLIEEVQNAVRNVDTGSRELAQATSDLSKGTVSQASSIQSLADSLSIITERINRNSQRAEQVNKNLGNLDNQIQIANVQMNELLNAVDEIETMSSSIQKIVSTIDSIAFQTNILSLNASVEAARAGEIGSGFAVVAEEIRSLAEKCGESSRRTSDLITDCISNIDNAKKCADSTFKSLSVIVTDSSTISTAFKEISEDTSEQAAKSLSIQSEVNIISDVVQTNTATVEETAASTEVLSEQAMNLENMVRSFKIKKS